MFKNSETLVACIFRLIYNADEALLEKVLISAC